MKIKTLIPAILVLCITGCKPSSPDGTYVVLTSEKLIRHFQGAKLSDDYDEQHSIALAQRVKGKKYTVAFNERYITLKSYDGQEVLINRNNEVAKLYPSDTTYQTGASINGNFHDILITAHTTRKEPTLDMRLIVYDNPIDSVGRFAFIRCELLKVKDK